jgi:hypothetical protein
MSINDLICPTMRTLSVIAILGLGSQASLAQRDQQENRTKGNGTGAYTLAQATVSKQEHEKEGVSKGSGAITLLNCSGRAITVKAFNSDDKEMVVPTQTNAIAKGQELTLKCGTSKCKLIIKALKGEPQSGYFVYKNNALIPSNAEKVGKGCRQFE